MINGWISGPNSNGTTNKSINSLLRPSFGRSLDFQSRSRENRLHKSIKIHEHACFKLICLMAKLVFFSLNKMTFKVHIMNEVLGNTGAALIVNLCESLCVVFFSFCFFLFEHNTQSHTSHRRRKNCVRIDVRQPFAANRKVICSVDSECT